MTNVHARASIFLPACGKRVQCEMAAKHVSLRTQDIGSRSAKSVQYTTGTVDVLGV